MPECYCTIAEGIRGEWGLDEDLNALLDASKIFPDGKSNQKCDTKMIIKPRGTALPLLRSDLMEQFQLLYEIRIRSKAKGSAQELLNALTSWCIPCFCTDNGKISRSWVDSMQDEHIPIGETERLARAVMGFVLTVDRQCIGT